MDDRTPERWLPVVGLEGYYEVSDRDRVRSLHRNSLHIMRPSYSNSGRYPLYILYANGVRYPRYGHHLVAEAFIGPRPEGQEVRHLDGNARSAALWDADGNQRLVYGTSSENKLDQIRHGTHAQGCKEYCDNGHEFTPENTRIQLYPDGTFKQRVCRACERESGAELRQKRLTDERRCKEEGCDKPYFALDWCSMHYEQNYMEQPGNREKVAARHAAWYQRRKDEGNPSWIPTADLPPEKQERRRALARERNRRLRERRRSQQMPGSG